MKNKLLTIALTCLLTGTLSSHATVLLDNGPFPADGITGQSGENLSLGSGTWARDVAIGFTIGTDSYDLTSLSLFLKVNTNASFSVQLWDSNGSVPGGSLFTFDNPDLIVRDSYTKYSFTTDTTLTLESGKTYYVVVNSLNDYFTTIAGSSKTLAQSSTEYAQMTSTIYSTRPEGAHAWNSPRTWAGTHYLTLEGTPSVPEPATTAAVIGVATAMTLLFARRFRCRK